LHFFLQFAPLAHQPQTLQFTNKFEILALGTLWKIIGHHFFLFLIRHLSILLFVFHRQEKPLPRLIKHILFLSIPQKLNI